MELQGLKKEDFEAWVPFGDDGKVLIRYVSREELKQIGKKAKNVTYRNHQKVEELDDMKADILLGRMTVRDWQGFTMNGDPFPCTPENIDFVMTKWSAFGRFINDICSDFDELVRAEKDATIKKSEVTSEQNQTSLM